MTKAYLGLDVGGTTVKGGVIDASGAVLAMQSAPTCVGNGADAVVSAILELAESLEETVKKSGCEICGIGIGSAGLVDAKAGIVRNAANLGLIDLPIVRIVQSVRGKKNVRVANDANAAALGEATFGAGKEKGDSLLLTLGTGVGGGMVLDGKIYEGNGGAGAELGHMVIRAGGKACGCGRKGCLEAYCSATALIRDTKEATMAHPDCKMREATEVTGRTPFDYAEKDPYAKKIRDEFIENLAVGIGNYMFIFRPNVIMLGGGISAQGDALIRPLDERLKREMGAFYLPKVALEVAKLGNKAGFMGAAALCMEL